MRISRLGATALTIASLSGVFLAYQNFSAPPATATFDQLIENTLDAAEEKAAQSVAFVGATGVAPKQIPRSTLPDGSWKLVAPVDFASGFFAGNLWQIYKARKSGLASARYFNGLLSKVRAPDPNRTDLADLNVDIGLQMASTYMNKAKLDPSGTAEKTRLLAAAADLAALYEPKIKAIPNRRQADFTVLQVSLSQIANMELLLWASKNGGPASYRNIAINHATTVMKNHIRPDGSTFQHVTFALSSGAVQKKFTLQGYADSSTWSRGQAYALYGFTMMYRETGRREFLGAAESLAGYWLNRLPADGIPAWDFDAPASTNPPKDSSAAAIASSALLELSTLAADPDYKLLYYNSGKKTMTTMMRKYLSFGNAKHMGLLLHGTGHYPNKSEVDVSLTYGDYYLLEAINRYKATAVPITFAKFAADIFTFANTKLTQSVTYAKANAAGGIAIPRSTVANGTWKLVHPDDWTSGFFAGTLWQMYRYNKGQLANARSYTALLSKVHAPAATRTDAANTGVDIGFQMATSYINKFKHDPSGTAEKVRLLAAAAEQAAIYDPRIRALPARKRADFTSEQVVLDHIMDLELLYWASKNGGPTNYATIATAHATTVMNNFFRSNYGTFHHVHFSVSDGSVVKQVTHQGYSNGSTWARGQAWAIYGFTMVHRETGRAEFLTRAQKAADYYISRLPMDGIPPWDFDAPAGAPKDTSAAAIAASGLLELSEFTTNATKKAFYRASAQKILVELATGYSTRSQAAQLGLLRQGVGHFPAGTEVGVSLNYGDYYFLEGWNRLLAIRAK